MLQIRFPKEYGYFWDLAKIIATGGELPLDEINLVGGRKSGKTTVVELFEAALCLQGCNNVGMISLRNMVNDSDELLMDYANTWDAYELPYHVKQGKRTLTLNGIDIRIMGVNSNRKGNKAKRSGLSKFGDVKYIIVFFEERFEFCEQDVQALKEAIRSINPENKNVQFLYINACNPWAKSSEYITYCGKWMTWDIKKLKETGSQVSIVNIPIGDGKYKRALFHYTNWRVAKEYLGDSEINQILDTWNIDPKRAATTDLGLPGYETGAIYTHVLNNLGRAIYQEHQFLSGGMDYGWGRETHSGKTVCYFMGWTPSEGLDIYGEWTHSNAEKMEDITLVAKKICIFYAEQMRYYCDKIGWYGSTFNLRVRVDNMAEGVVQILNSTAQSMRLTWLKFVKCVKFPVNDRIEITLGAMYKHQIRLGDSVKLLKQEMELAFYEETASATQKRAKVNDHGLNAFEYGIEPFMYKIAKDNGQTTLAMKKETLW